MPRRARLLDVVDAMRTWQKGVRGRLARRARRHARGDAGARAPGEYRNFLHVTRTNREALRHYRLGRYDGVVTFFAAEVRQAALFAAFRARTSCRLDVIEVGGDHLSMVEPPHLAPFVTTWRALLDGGAERAATVPPGALAPHASR